MANEQMASGAEAERWAALKHPLPDWFNRAKLGYFIHWGPYSVPAWGEPIAELGTIPPGEWYTHNPYAEWYYNTIRIPGSPAQKHHQEVYGGAPYDDFLDRWKAEKFDPEQLVGLLAEGGAGYLVLTTKHHDGVCLWDAPETGDRNTVRRGPKRDLVGAYAQACRNHGVRFGTYYSGGLDWFVRPTDPIGPHESWHFEGLRPLDAEYASYAANHLRDLIERYQPDVLWNDIEWPDAGKNFSSDGIGRVFEEYYAAHPDGVVNDRWNVPHADYLTSEYQHLLDSESAEAWENCRGLGLSFGYNQMEGPEHALLAPDAMKHLVDVVTRGGHLLLGVGPKADGTLPEWQEQIVRNIGRWTGPMAELLAELKPTKVKPDLELGDTWIRFGDWNGNVVAFMDADHPVPLPAGSQLLSPGWANLVDTELTMDPDRPGPAVVQLP